MQIQMADIRTDKAGIRQAYLGIHIGAVHIYLRTAGVYNVAGEDTRPLKSYIEEVYELCGRKGSYEFGYRPPNAEGCVSLMPDLTKLKKAIDFHQQVSFKEGILETIKEAKKENI